MSKIKNIIAGTAALAGSVILIPNANAQEVHKNIFAPAKVSTETSAITNREVSGVPFQRVEAGNDYWAFKYDVNMKLKPEDTPVNVGMLAINKLYSKNNLTIGAEIFQVGKFNKNDIWFVDAWIEKKYENLSLMLDYGKGFQIDKHSKDYIIGTAKSPKITLEGCIYPQGSLFEKGIDVLQYGFISFHDKNKYVSAGRKISTSYASAGVYGLENFGTLLYGTFNHETDELWFKSQTAIGSVNKEFYSQDMFEIASEYFAMPAYFTRHFSPLSNKGTVALKTEIRKCPAKGTTETEFMLGTNKTPFVQIGLGINTEYKKIPENGIRSVKSHVALELYKEVKVGKFKGSAEYRCNFRKHEGTAYIKMCRTF